MRKFALLMVFTVLVSALAYAPALATNKIWYGSVEHVSTNNIKVQNPNGNVTLSFLLVPKFKQIFSDDGKTTVQMAKLKNGMWVKVYYDQNLLGARHADKIIILKSRTEIKS